MKAILRWRNAGDIFNMVGDSNGNWVDYHDHMVAIKRVEAQRDKLLSLVRKMKEAETGQDFVLGAQAVLALFDKLDRDSGAKETP